MRDRFSVAKCCCGTDCTIVSDDFDRYALNPTIPVLWEFVAQSAFIAGTAMEIDDDDAIIINTAEDPIVLTAGYAQLVTVDIRIETAGDEAKIFLGYDATSESVAYALVCQRVD